MNPNSITLLAVGDISLGDFPFCIGYGVKSIINREGSKFIFENIRELFNNADINFGNLETTLSLNGLKKNKLASMEMRGNPNAIEGLMDVNFNILNIANNHAMQHGEDCFFETTELLEQNNIKPLGLSGNKGWHSEPAVIETKGLRLGFLGYAFEDDKYFHGSSKYAFGVPEHIINDIKRLRPTVDYLIVSCHWGLEFINRPSVSNIRLARQIIDCGADVILGHHPHVLQGYERYKKGLIFYSLGNFVFDMNWDKRFQQSMIVKIIFDKEKPISFEIIPVIINSSYQPEIADKKNSDRLSNILHRLSKKIDMEVTGDTDYNSCRYYLEYEKLRKKNRLKCYIYFLKNIHRSSYSMLVKIICRTVKRRIDDVAQLLRKTFVREL